jgi:hypothetical protein
MKRNRFTSRKRISADATELSRLAIGLAESGSKLEDLFWQNRLGELVDKLFHDGPRMTSPARWTACSTRMPMAHDDLADIIEAHAESCVLSHLGQEFDILLFAAPLLAWSRFSIPTGDPEEHPADAESPSRRACLRCRVPGWRSPTICTARINCRTASSIPGN